MLPYLCKIASAAMLKQVNPLQLLTDGEGLRFWAVIRMILDKCRTVDDAVKLINELPISSYCNLIIADRQNCAALVEIYQHINKRRV